MSTAILTPGEAAAADPGRGTTSSGGGSSRPVYPLGWLRGLAALTVVIFHAYQHDRDPGTGAWPLSGVGHQIMIGSDMWVDMFFVLSGLVLWLPVAGALARGEAARSGRMLLYRRLARLVPLYAVIVCVVWALTNPVLPGHWPDLVLHLTFTHVYSNTYIFWTDGPAWSLAVEFHFYVLMALSLPALFAWSRRLGSHRARLGLACVLPLVCLAATVVFLVWATVLTRHSPDDWRLWYGPLSRGGDFGLGMLLATLAAAGVRLGRAARAALGVVGVVLTAVLVLIRPLDSTASEWWHLLYSLALVIGFGAIVLHDGPWPVALSWRPLAWVGGVGYGVYLVHEPVMRLLDHEGLLPGARPGLHFLITATIVLVPTLALAWLSSRTVEAAGLRLLSAWRRDGSPRDYYAHYSPPGHGESDPHIEPGSPEESGQSRQRGSTSRATASRTSTDPA